MAQGAKLNSLHSNIRTFLLKVQTLDPTGEWRGVMDVRTFFLNVRSLELTGEWHGVMDVRTFILSVWTLELSGEWSATTNIWTLFTNIQTFDPMGDLAGSESSNSPSESSNSWYLTNVWKSSKGHNFWTIRRIFASRISLESYWNVKSDGTSFVMIGDQEVR